MKSSLNAPNQPGEDETVLLTLSVAGIMHRLGKAPGAGGDGIIEICPGVSDRALEVFKQLREGGEVGGGMTFRERRLDHYGE